MDVTIYQRPNAQKTTLYFDKINEDDRQWFTENDFTLSLEPLDENANFTALYALKGDDEDNEVISVVDISEVSCEDAFHALRQKCEKQYAPA